MKYYSKRVKTNEIKNVIWRACFRVYELVKKSPPWPLGWEPAHGPLSPKLPVRSHHYRDSERSSTHRSLTSVSNITKHSSESPEIWKGNNFLGLFFLKLTFLNVFVYCFKCDNKPCVFSPLAVADWTCKVTEICIFSAMLPLQIQCSYIHYTLTFVYTINALWYFPVDSCLNLLSALDCRNGVIRWRLVLYFPDTEFHTFFSGQVPISSDIHVVRTFPDMSGARLSCRSWPIAHLGHFRSHLATCTW